MVRHVSFSEVYGISQRPGPGQASNPEYPYYSSNSENGPATIPRLVTLCAEKYPGSYLFICREKLRHHRYSEISDPSQCGVSPTAAESPPCHTTSAPAPTTPPSPTTTTTEQEPRQVGHRPHHRAHHVRPGTAPATATATVSAPQQLSPSGLLAAAATATATATPSSPFGFHFPTSGPSSAGDPLPPPVAVTCGEFVATARTLAKGLLASGLTRGDTVGVVGPNSVDWATAELAVVFAGAVFVPFDEHTSAEALSHYAKECRCSLFFVGSEAHEAKLMTVWDGLPDLRMVIKCHASVKWTGGDKISGSESPHDPSLHPEGRSTLAGKTGVGSLPPHRRRSRRLPQRQLSEEAGDPRGSASVRFFANENSSSVAAAAAGACRISLASTTVSSCETVFSTDSLLQRGEYEDDEDPGSVAGEDPRLPRQQSATGPTSGDSHSKEPSKEVVDLAALLRIGATESDEKLDEEMKAQKSGDVCLILYTAGTSGLRRGAMLSHDNLIFSSMKTAECLNASFQLFGEAGCVATFASFAGALGQTLGMFAPLVLGLPVVIVPPEATNLADEEAIRSVLKTYKPMVLVGTPPHLATLRRIAWKDELENGRIIRTVQKWSKFWTLAYHLDRMKGRSWLPQTLSYHMFRLITLWKTKQHLGLDKCKLIICSGGPVSSDNLEDLLSLDFPIVQGYSLTEASGLCHLEDSRFTVLGSVGPAIPGVKCRIDDADENGIGEILIQGRQVFAGYVNDTVRTMSALTDDGWFRTGDIGKIDRFGRLYVVARKGEIITLSNGKTVVASHVEKHLLSDIPCLSHVLVVGDRRPYLTALLSLKTEIDRQTGLPLDDLTDEAVSWCKTFAPRAGGPCTVSGILSAPDQFAMRGIGRAIGQCNEKWATCEEEMVRRWQVLPRSFSPASEECSPAMAIRRSVAIAKYRGLIESMYEDHE